MIRLKPILEIQLIKEALPLSKAREFVNIERNPGIEKHLNLIFEKLKAEPGAKVLNELGRIAIPFPKTKHGMVPSELLNYDEDFNTSRELSEFMQTIWKLERTITNILYRSGDKFDSKYKQINNNMLSYYNFITGQNLKDQYGRAVKVSKFIPYLVTTYYIVLNTWNSSDDGISKDVLSDEQLKSKIKEQTNKLLADYDSIPEVKIFRQSSVSDHVQYYIVYSKHAYDIAGMSTDRGWTSCMNIYTGMNKHYIQHDIKEGTIVAYLIKESDFNINNPTARLSIKPYVNIENPDDVFFQPETKIYGSAPGDFQSVVNKIFDKIQPGKSGTFELVDTLYCDSGVRDIKK
jgi:hypothetical protein